MRLGTPGSGEVGQRAVLYIAGFDPRGAAKYHKLTCDEFAKHCNMRDLEFSVSDRRRETRDRHEWSLSASSMSNVVSTRFTFLGWDQMVRRHWIRQDALAILKGAWTSMTPAGLSAQRILLRLSWPMAVTVLGPLLVVLGSTAVLLLSAILVFTAANGPHFVGVTGLFAVIALSYYLFKAMVGFNAPWVARIILFIYNGSRKTFLRDWDGPERMAAAILDALHDPKNDEVLVVSHSVGVLIALLAFERAIVQGRDDIDRAISEGRLTFVTLGQSIPLMSSFSSDLLRALKSVGDSRVVWLDVSSPTDPACFAMVDSYCEHFSGPQRMHILNAQLYKNFSAATFQLARQNRFVMHFMYLMSPDGQNPASFDFYDLLSSGSRLSDRLPVVPKVLQPYYRRRRNP